MKRPPHEDAKRWFIHAKDEFDDAEELRQRKRYYLALFHFQQVAEKALRAYLYNIVSSEDIFFTHSIYELLIIALEKDRDFESVKEGSRLDEYYIPTRYPNGLPGGIPSRFYQNPEEAENAKEWAEKIILLVEKKLNPIKGGGQFI